MAKDRGLNFYIQVIDKDLIKRSNLDPKKKYLVQTMDHESYYIEGEFDNERVEVKWGQAKEFRPRQG